LVFALADAAGDLGFPSLVPSVAIEVPLIMLGGSYRSLTGGFCAA
jgi:hypothetical protein